MDGNAAHSALAQYNKLSALTDGDQIAEELSLVLKGTFSLQHLWIYRTFFKKLESAHFARYPSLCCGRALIEAMSGELQSAAAFMDMLPQSSLYYLFGQLVLPSVDRQEYADAVKTVTRLQLGAVPNLTLTAGRPSVLNGYRDFSPYGGHLRLLRQPVLDAVQTLYGVNSKGIYEVALAEAAYQRDDCYEALVLVVGARPLLQQEKEVRALFAALFLEIEIMLMNGQARVAVPLMEEIREQMIGTGHVEYLPNLYALEAWAAMYDGNYARAMEWMHNDAPDEYGAFCMVDLYRYMIKMRGYLISGKHLAITALAKRLIPLLEAGHRYMDRCETYMLLAFSDHTRGDNQAAFDNLERALQLARRYRYDRLLADEGKRMCLLLTDYQKARGKDPYITRILTLARKVATIYPQYLREQLQEQPTLSRAEVGVLQLMADGMRNAVIAEMLGVSENTVKFHAKNIFRKLSVTSRSQAVASAKSLGIL